MRALKVCLWIAGIGCQLAVIGLFLPMTALNAMGAWFGDQAFPDSPVFQYTMRAMSATFVAIGVFYIILALRPMAYGVLVPFSGFAAIFVGVSCLLVGLATKLPPLWFLGDFLSCTIIGLLIVLFWRRVRVPAVPI